MCVMSKGGDPGRADIWNGPGGTSTHVGLVATTSDRTHDRTLHPLHGRGRLTRWSDCNHGKRCDSLLWHISLPKEQIWWVALLLPLPSFRLCGPVWVSVCCIL